MKVSYYELLEMIKDNNIPKEIYLCILDRKIKYKAIFNGEYFNYYEIADKNNQTNDFNFYLRDCLLDSESFKKIIEIVPKEIEKLSYQQIGTYDNDLIRIVRDTNKQISQIGKKLNETIEELNELKGKGE